MSISEKLTQIAENQQAVYDAGKQAEYDAFWNTFQQSGNRTSYANGISGRGWTVDNFKPKYDIIVGGSALSMFMYNGVKADLVELLKNCGVVLDFSSANSLQMTFQSAWFTRLGEIDASNAGNVSQTFMAMPNLVTIDKLILGEKNTGYSAIFTSTTTLKNITIDGVIVRSINFSPCSKLTLESALSIVNHLKNLTGTDTTATITLHANTWALLDADTSFPEHTPAEEGATASWKTYLTDVLGWGWA